MGQQTLCFHFPLRPRYLAQVVLPGNLTKQEADRLCEFVRSLAQASPVAEVAPTKDQP